MTILRTGASEDSGRVPLSFSSLPILIADEDDFTAHRYKYRLARSGFTHVETVGDFQYIEQRLKAVRYELVFIGVHCENRVQESFSVLEEIRYQGFDSCVCMLCDNPTLKQFFHAANLGANDLVVKGRFLDIVGEAIMLLDRTRDDPRCLFHHDAALKTGFFRSLGMTQVELEVLIEFSKGFPKQRELAKRLGKNNAQLHKVFSRIYQKLGGSLCVDNPAKLSFLLTICSFCQ
jgi:DNA-binding response OmpR family regulator